MTPLIARFLVPLAVLAATPALANDAMPLPADATELESNLYAILEKNCSRCHQVGALKEGLSNPKSGFGFVLDIRRLGQDAKYVVAGKPIGSKIYDVFGQFGVPPMPDDCDPADFACYPGFEESDVLKQWIVSLADQAPEPRTFVSLARLYSEAFADLQEQPTNRRDRIRYLSLREVHNDPTVTDDNLEGYVTGAVKLINALSWNPAPFQAETVGDSGVLIQIFLPDVNWSVETWHLLESHYPYGMISDTDRTLSALQDMANTAVPVLRADWFAANASVSPLYYDVLELPETVAGLETLLGLDMLANIRNEQVVRAGFQDSGVSDHNRLIERHTLGTGFFWTSYDFAGSAERQSFFRNPIGPKEAFGDVNAFAHDGGESIFTLPNGFHAYYLNTSDGARLNVGPTSIVVDTEYTDATGEVVNGISCMSCHSKGIRQNDDEVREIALADRSLPASTRQIIDAIYPGPEAVAGYFDRDTQQFFAALRSAGLDPEMTAGGREPVRGLFVYHLDLPIRMAQAASELGLTEEELRDAAAFVGPEMANLVTRLDRTELSRDEWAAAFPILLKRVTDYAPMVPRPIDISHLPYSVRTVVDTYADDTIPVVHDPDTKVPDLSLADYADPYDPALYDPSAHSNATTSHLTVYTEKTAYKVGERVRIFVEPRHDCQLTLISIDAQRRSCVIYPHPALDDAPIKGGTQYVFPPQGGLRTSEVGEESILAICNGAPEALATAVRDLGKVSCDPDLRDPGHTDVSSADVVNEMLLFDPEDDEKTPVNGADYNGLSTQNPYVARSTVTITVTDH